MQPYLDDGKLIGEINYISDFSSEIAKSRMQELIDETGYDPYNLVYTAIYCSKGTWNGMSRIGEWSGEWKEEYLLDKWKSLKEIDWKHEFFRKLEGYIEAESDKDMTGKTLLLGTSTFEYWYTSKEDLSPEYDSINFGVGGSTAKWWNENAELLKGVKGCPEQILLFIGGNDVASSYSTEDIVRRRAFFVCRL